VQKGAVDRVLVTEGWVGGLLVTGGWGRVVGERRVGEGVAEDRRVEKGLLGIGGWGKGVGDRRGGMGLSVTVG
jgi:hypothetical protein